MSVHAFRSRWICALVAALALALVAGQAQASEEAAGPEGFWPSLVAAFDPILDVNLRWEYAKIDGFQHSHSATARTRFGLKTKAWHGFSGLLEGVNTVSPKPSGYFDAVETNDGPQSVVADPERTDVNRVWLAYENPDVLGLKLKGGRQRIKFDDDRWVGNVGWRQNEQTFDAARFQTDLGLEKLLLQYVYVWQVNRIFGDQGPAGTRDFGPRAHFFNVGYEAGKFLKAVGFVYLVDPNDNTFRAFGSATFGARFTGKIELTEKLFLPYQASYAYQEDWGNNQTSYGAHYAYLESGLGVKKVGTLLVGYEHLGSDGDARIVTPFSTAHKFNGFADAFLNNGGARGLRDFYVAVVPAIPVKGLKLKMAFHQFWDDQGGDNLGQEYDLVTSYAVNKYLSFLWKVAYFDGGKTRSPGTRTRSTLQTVFKF